MTKVDSRPALTRRQALAAGAALPLAAPLLAGPARAQANDMLGTSTPSYNRFALGAFEVTTLLVGSRAVECRCRTF